MTPVARISRMAKEEYVRLSKSCRPGARFARRIGQQADIGWPIRGQSEPRYQLSLDSAMSKMVVPAFVASNLSLIFQYVLSILVKFSDKDSEGRSPPEEML